MREEQTMYATFYNFIKPDIDVPEDKKKNSGGYPKQLYFFDLMFPKQIRGDDYSLQKDSLITVISKEVNKGIFRQSLIDNLNNDGNDFEQLYKATIQTLKDHNIKIVNGIQNICQYNEIEVPEDIKSDYFRLLLFFLKACVNQKNPLNEFIKQKKISSNHLKEYLKEVVWKDGISGKAGIRNILYLAEHSLAEGKDKKNPFILYEAGEIEYYGRGRSHIPDYEKAYQYYQEAATEFQHPLALWSMGYMIMNLAEKGEALSVHNQLSREKRYERALVLFNACLMQDAKCGAAYNSLGKACKNNNIPEPLKEKYIYKWGCDAKELFQKSRKNGNVYGMNNYYDCLVKGSRNKEEEIRKKALEEAFEVIKEAAALLNPWAANRLAEIYFQGKIDGVKINNVERDIELAKRYYEIAVYTQLDDNCYWGNYNYVNNILLNPQITMKPREPIEESIRLLRAILEDEKMDDLELKAKSCVRLAHLYYSEQRIDRLKDLLITKVSKIEEEFDTKKINLDVSKRKEIQDSLTELQNIYQIYQTFGGQWQ